MTPAPSLPLRRSFLDRLAAMRTLAFPFFRGIQPRSTLSGPPTEFEGHRPYLPGDDTRWIDWNLFARLEELYVKVFQVEEEVEVLILVDSSSSMTAGSGGKYKNAAAAASALSYLAILTSHPVTVLRYAERALDSRGPYRHLEGFSSVNELLLSPPAGGGTDLRQALGPHLARRRRPVTVVALSDGFQREPVDRVAAAFGGNSDRRFIFVRISSPDDLRPPLRGVRALVDIEGGGSSIFVADRALEKQMHRRIASYLSGLDESLRMLGASSSELPTGKDFEEEFVRLLMGSIPADTAVGIP